jgi:signal transduction histidine kinase
MLKEGHFLLLRYGTAVLTDALALLLTLLLWPLIEPTITPLFFVAVMVSAWYGGLGPGLLATILAAFASAYFFIPPLYSLNMGWDDLLRLGVFLLVALAVNSLTVARRRAEEALRSAHDELERRVQTRTAELVNANRINLQLYEEGEQRRAELQRLSAELRRAQENERRRIARDLHDGVAQLLSGLLMHIDLLGNQIRGVSSAEERVEQIKSLVEQALDEVRGLVWTLRPTALDDLGLPDALRGLVANLSRNARVDIALQIDDGLPSLSPPVATALYRIAQEALSNVFRHAHASAVSVYLGKENGAVQLMIADNGQGVDVGALSAVSQDNRGVGLWSMRERAEEVGGTFSFRSVPGAGTTIVVIVKPTAGTEARKQ